MANVAVRASSSNSAGTGTAMSVSMPTGTQAGDAVVIFAHGNGQSTIADNNGSTAFTEDLDDYKPNTASGHVVSVFKRRIQSGDPTTYNFTLGTSGRWSLVAVTFSDPNATDIFDTAISTQNIDDLGAGGGTITAGSVTTTVANSIHLVAAVWDTSVTGTLSNNGSYTNASSIATNQPTAVYWKVIASAGASGSVDISNTEFGSRISIAVAVKNNTGGSTSVKDIIGGMGIIPFAR